MQLQFGALNMTVICALKKAVTSVFLCDLNIWCILWMMKDRWHVHVCMYVKLWQTVHVYYIYLTNLLMLMLKKRCIHKRPENVFSMVGSLTGYELRLNVKWNFLQQNIEDWENIYHLWYVTFIHWQWPL